MKAPMPMPSVVLTGPPWGMNFLGAAARGALWSLLGLASARAFFPDNAPVLAVVLVALGQSSYVQALLDRNRQEVYGGAISARRANLRMARELFGLFLGIYAAYVFAVSLVAPERLTTVFGGLLAGFQGARLSDVDFGTFGTLMAKNGAVLMASFLIFAVLILLLTSTVVLVLASFLESALEF